MFNYTLGRLGVGSSFVVAHSELVAIISSPNGFMSFFLKSNALIKDFSSSSTDWLCVTSIAGSSNEKSFFSSSASTIPMGSFRPRAVGTSRWKLTPSVWF